MSQVARVLEPISVEEYLRFEETAGVKHEYVEGYLHAMSGARDRHVRVTLNLASRLLAASRDGPCRVYASDMKVQVSNRFYYPDAMVVCDPGDDGDLYKGRPCLIVEVLSKSTQRTDRGEKLLAYQGLLSLETYLIVDPDRPRLEVHRRIPAGWTLEVLEREGELALSCPALTLRLADVYEGLEPRP